MGRRRRLQPLSLLRTALTELLEGAPPTHVQEPVHAAAAIVRERHGLDVPDIRMSKVGRKLYVEVVFLVECGHSDVDAEDAVRRAFADQLADLPYDLWLNVELTTDRGLVG